MVSAIASSTVFAASSATTTAMPMACSRALGLGPALAFSTRFFTKPFSSSPSLRVSCSPLLYSPLAVICHEELQCKRQSIRCKVTRSGDSGYSPLSSNSNWSDRPPTEMAPLFPGCDYEHWLIVMDPLNDGKATKDEMIDHYIKTLAKVLGSEEAAKKSIYNVSCERYYGFGCQIDEETSAKLEGLPGVCFVLPDSYVDVENKDYGAELLVDGKIVERSPERQRRVTPQPMRNNSDRPRYNDRTRYVRRRENQSQGR
ncbi:hypothetical protein SUGI_1140360 [Cryptomeria japonica]|nr:hypothetical protein SUGI_1140360 [Cryptomeria japonica]